MFPADRSRFLASNAASHRVEGRSMLFNLIARLLPHVLSDRPGDWQVSIVGSRANDGWELKIIGPNAFERSYTLERIAHEHEPTIIGGIVSRMVPGRKG